MTRAIAVDRLREIVATGSAADQCARLYELLEQGGEDMVRADAVRCALRDAHARDSAADAVEYVSDLVGWDADCDAPQEPEPEPEPGERLSILVRTRRAGAHEVLTVFAGTANASEQQARANCGRLTMRAEEADALRATLLAGQGRTPRTADVELQTLGIGAVLAEQPEELGA